MAIPAPAAAMMPRMALPVVRVTAKPMTAPSSIMPSMPRLRTPDFSVTSSPVAASSSGVEALITERMTGTSQETPLMGPPVLRTARRTRAEDRPRRPPSPRPSPANGGRGGRVMSRAAAPLPPRPRNGGEGWGEGVASMAHPPIGMARTRFSARSCGGLLPAAAEARAVEDQNVRAQEEEEQDALEDVGDGAGQAEIDLGGIAAEIGERQQQPGEEHAHQVQPAEKGDDDRREAVARRDLGGELADGPGDLEQAGGAGKPAPQQHGEPDQPLVAEAGIARGARRLAHDLELKPHEGFAEQRPAEKYDNEGDEHAEMDPGPGDQD